MFDDDCRDECPEEEIDQLIAKNTGNVIRMNDRKKIKHLQECFARLYKSRTDIEIERDRALCENASLRKQIDDLKMKLYNLTTCVHCSEKLSYVEPRSCDKCPDPDTNCQNIRCDWCDAYNDDFEDDENEDDDEEFFS